jgi:hypothetical protein
MDKQSGEDQIRVPRADAWLAGGLAALAGGVWLLRLDDPYLFTMWGIGLVLLGSVAALLGIAMLLHMCR